MDEADLARFTEDVLVALAGAVDRQGLKIRLAPDQEITVLASAIAAVMNRRTDLALFRPISLGPGGSIRMESNDG
ncbi:MAG TPA: hypothetical protein VGF50_14245 [Caulobacteraceae bacterium]|jgi:hypothetical protein